ncbi:MAG: L,D-transpeptidase [Solirubrobacteraceae bacterium]
MTDPVRTQPRRRLRALLAGVAVLIPLIPIVVALLLNGGSGAARAVTTTAVTHFDPVKVKPLSVATTRLLPPGRGALVALVLHPTALRSAPGHGRTLAKVTTHTGFGSSQTFWVVKLSGAWLGVISNLAGNNRVGWIPASAASLSRVDWELKASLAARELTVLHNGKAIRHYSIAIGAPTAPTPTGRFAVTDRLSTGDPTGPYGCCILALSAQAPHAIQDWSGGNRIAVHSTPETDSIGHPVSHGCMRLTLAEGRWLLAHIPLGTPAVVSSA